MTEMRPPLSSTSMTLLGRLIASVSHCFTPEAAWKLVSLRADKVVQARLEELADKCTEGQLSSDEQQEYATVVAALEFIGILQAHARRVLSNTG